MEIPRISFSITDFMAYFVPGTVMLMSILGLILLLNPLWSINFNDINFGTAILGVTLAYFLGVVISGPASFLEDHWPKHMKKDGRSSLPVNKSIVPEIQTAYWQLFGQRTSKWNKDHFYIVRSYLRHRYPAIAEELNRQNSLGQLRRNGVIPSIAGIIVLFLWGYYLYNSNFPDKECLGTGLMTLSANGLYLVYFMITGIKRNRNRECREVCTALLAITAAERSKLNSSVMPKYKGGPLPSRL